MGLEFQPGPIISPTQQTSFTSHNYQQAQHQQQQRVASKKTMSISQTYFLAHKARAKLAGEAARSDHNLRLLVGHANMLDSIMLDLANAEQEQESWVHQTVKNVSPVTSDRHVQWADHVSQPVHEEEFEADSSDSELDIDMEEDDDMEMMEAVALQRMSSQQIVSAPPRLHITNDGINDGYENTPGDDGDDDDVNMDYEDEDEDYAALSLTRSSSHSNSPPELDHDSDSSEDEVMPPSPPFSSAPTFLERQRTPSSSTFYDAKEELDDDRSEFYYQGYFIPRRRTGRIAPAISVC